MMSIGERTTKNNEFEAENLKEELENEIRCCHFAITDISLFLNTHPNSRKALRYYRSQCNKLKDLEEKYQKMFGPLCITFPCNRWRWLEGNWPWEGSED